MAVFGYTGSLKTTIDNLIAGAKNRANHTGTQSADTVVDGTTNKAFLATERTKLAAIAAGATANRTDAATDTAIATAVGDLVNGAAGALDQLNELATALGNDANFATTVTNELAKRVRVWTANTAFTAGQPVINPSGQLVTANTSFTSGTTYTASNWTPVYAISGTNTGDQTISINGAVLTISGANGNSITIPTAGGGGAVSDATSTAKGVVQLAGDLAGTAAAPTVPGLAAKAPLASPAFTGTPTGISKSHVGLGNVDNTSDTSKPLSTAATTALAAKADLVGGVIPTAQIPAIAVIDYLGTSASQSAMLALTGQKGDWTIRTDLGTTWIITGTDPTQLASWTALGYPTAPVQSVAGRTGTVTLTKTDVGLGNVDNTADTAKPVSTAQQTALDGKASTQSVTDNANAIAQISLSGTPATLTSAGTMTAGKVNLLDATAGAFTATLPTPTRIGQVLAAERIDTTTNLISFGGTVRGVAAVANLPGLGVAGESFFFVAESLTSWRITATHKPNALLAAQFAPLGPRTQVLVYSGSAYPARPSTTVCPAGWAVYKGPSQPTDWLSNDEWVNNN